MPLNYDAEMAEEIRRTEERFKKYHYAWFRYILPVGYMFLAGLVAWLLSVFGVNEIPAAIMGACTAIVSAIGWLAYEIKYQLAFSLAVTEWIGRKQLGEHQKPYSE